MKKLVLYICLWLLALVTAVTATPTADNIGFAATHMCTNSTVIVPLNITNTSEPIVAFICNVHFNTNITQVVSVTQSALTSHWDILYSNKPYGIRIAGVYDSNISHAIPSRATGPIALLHFKSLTPGQTNLNLSDIQLSGPDYTIGTASAQNSTLTVWKRGDLNGDGEVATISDVGLMWDAFLGLRQTDCRYDINEDGKEAGIGDVALIWHMYLGEA